jgi:hypothetical protein
MLINGVLTTTANPYLSTLENIQTVSIMNHTFWHICTLNQTIIPSLTNPKILYAFVELPNQLLLLPKQWTRPNAPGRSKSYWNTITLARSSAKKSLRDFLEVAPGIMLLT